nr:MAG TPA: hypothetical protein [Caudoviricetes sp.]
MCHINTLKVTKLLKLQHLSTYSQYNYSTF